MGKQPQKYTKSVQAKQIKSKEQQKQESKLEKKRRVALIQATYRFGGQIMLGIVGFLFTFALIYNLNTVEGYTVLDVDTPENLEVVKVIIQILVLFYYYSNCKIPKDVLIGGKPWLILCTDTMASDGTLDPKFVGAAKRF